MLIARGHSHGIVKRTAIPRSSGPRGLWEGVPRPAASGSRILIVDDDASVLRTLERVVANAGWGPVRTTTDAREATTLYRTFRPDLVILDLRMPHVSGLDLLGSLRQEDRQGEYVPIVILTGDGDPEILGMSFSRGAQDFLRKPLDATEIVPRLRNLLETRRLHSELADTNVCLEAKVRKRTRELERAQMEILLRLAQAAEHRDDDTSRHAERVGLIAAAIARTIGLPPDQVDVLQDAATLHDVGKIGIPDAILLKPGSLTEEEFTKMRSHTWQGAEILSGARFELLRVAEIIALTHHERWDGTGYPQGLSRERVPLVGRIVAVADVFDSLTHARPYKGAMPRDEAARLVAAGARTHFDPYVVSAFLALLARGTLDDLGTAGLRPPARRVSRGSP